MLNLAVLVVTLIAATFLAATDGNVWFVAFMAFLAGINVTLVVVYQIFKE